MSVQDILNIRTIDQMTAIAGQPTESELRELKNEGYECVFNIAPYDPRYSLEDEEKLVRSLDMEYLFLPVDFNRPTLDDFKQFEDRVHRTRGKKTLIHCAANYRASVFFGHYAIKHLGWNQEQCDALIADVWQLRDFPVWNDFVSTLRQHVIGADQHASDVATKISDSVIDTIKRYLILSRDDQFESIGRNFLRDKIGEFVRNERKILILLPGFPCKSPNKIDKTFGVLPDMGEMLAVERLDNLCDDINAIYEPGCELTILCDGTTFADVVEVPDAEKNAYNTALRDETITRNVRWADLSAFFGKVTSEDAARKLLVNQTSLKSVSLDKYIAKVEHDEKLRALHDQWCSYLYNDIRPEHINARSRDDYLQSIAQKAYEMMYRGQALVENIDRAYPNHIRLSVHQYNNTGPKFTVALTPHAKMSQAPWHNVPLRLVDGTFRLLPHAKIKKDTTALVTWKRRNWFYMEVENENQTKFGYEIVKAPRFGLVIRDSFGTGFNALTTALLTRWVSDFGFVVLKNMRLPRQEELVEFCRPFGEIYYWHFGPVHVVKPHEKPDGFVHSTEKIPLHWDLSMLPLTHERVAKNETFAARMFMLYCNKTDTNSGGQTTLVDSRTALRLAGPKKVEQWKRTKITYFTKMTYFGGAPRTYPLVMKHPDKDDWILRYQEGIDSELQKFSLSSDEMDDESLASLIREINDIVYDDRCMVAYDWEAGDLLLVDNYYTLHGRLPMTSPHRELWRVQIT